MKNLILVLFIVSCLPKEGTINEINIDSSNYFLDTIQLQNNIIGKGDIYSYNRLEDIYELPEDSLTYRLLKYSYIIVDKYNYEEANYKIVRDIVRKELKTNNLSLIGDLDDKNKNEVFTRLNKCVQQNNVDCIVILRDYYKKNNNKFETEKLEKRLDSIIYK